jgi:hypothetical protein
MRRIEHANKFELVLSIKARVFLLVRVELLSVRFWPLAGIEEQPPNARFRGKADIGVDLAASPCVKSR